MLVVSFDMSENARKALIDAMLILNGDEHNDLLYSLYEASSMLPITADNHMGTFGENIDALVGFEGLLLDKYNRAP